MIIKIILAAVIAYLLGSLNTSILVGKIYGKDIRSFGSGNAGLTNTLRVLGKKAAIFVLIGDLLKGIIACLISALIIGKADFDPYIIGGAFAIIGHNWPVFFGFKGGKGALIAVGVAFMIDPLSAAIILGIFILMLVLFRFVSLSTITAGIFYPLITYIITKDVYILMYSLLFAAIIIVKHRGNIKRLINKEEPKLGSSTK